MSVPNLSEIEREIVLLAAEGRSRRAIADVLGLSRGTVEWHLIRAQDKLARAAALHARVRGIETGCHRKEAG